MLDFPKVSLQDHLPQNHLKSTLNLGAWDSALSQGPQMSCTWYMEGAPYGL